MSSSEQISTDLHQTDLVVPELRVVFEALKSHQFQVSTMCQQWQDFDTSFSEIRAVMDSSAKGLEAKSKDISSKEKELELRDKQLMSREKELEFKEKQRMSREKQLELKQKQLKSSRKKLEAREKQLETSEQQLELKRKQLAFSEKDIGWKVKQLQLLEGELQKKQNHFEELKRYISCQSKFAELGRYNQPNDAGEVVVNSDLDNGLPLDDGEVAYVKLNLKKMDGKTLQSFLNDKFNEHKSMVDGVYDALKKLSNKPARLVLDAIEGFFPPHLKNGDVEFETTVVRSSCVLLLEQLLRTKPVISVDVRVDAQQLSKRWREKIKEEGESYSVALGFLLLIAVYGIHSDYDKSDLEMFLAMIHQYGQASQLGEILGLPVDKDGIMPSAVKNGQPEPETSQVTRTVASISIKPSRKQLISLCKQMDVKGLKKYMCSHSLGIKVSLEALKSSKNPTTLVFDLTRAFYKLANGSPVKVVSAVGHGCIRLMEALMNLSFEVSSSTRSAALKFASIWKERLDAFKKKPVEVYGFLQFVATFKLSSSFSAVDLLALLGTFYDDGVQEFDNNPKLCDALGLIDKIPDVVETLIKENQNIRAVRYIIRFKLVNRFPPIALLRAYLDNSKELVDAKKKNGTISAQIDAINEECGALKAVIQCINDCKLESEFPSPYLIQRFSMLEKEKALCEKEKAVCDKEKAVCAKTGTKRPAPAELEKQQKKPIQEPSSYPKSNCVAPITHSSPYLSSMLHGPHPYPYNHSTDCRPVHPTAVPHSYSHPSHVAPPMNPEFHDQLRPLFGGVVGNGNGSCFGSSFRQGRDIYGCGDSVVNQTYLNIDRNNLNDMGWSSYANNMTSSISGGYYGGGAPAHPPQGVGAPPPQGVPPPQAHVPYPRSYGFQHAYYPSI